MAITIHIPQSGDWRRPASILGAGAAAVALAAATVVVVQNVTDDGPVTRSAPTSISVPVDQSGVADFATSTGLTGGSPLSLRAPAPVTAVDQSALADFAITNGLVGSSPASLGTASVATVNSADRVFVEQANPVEFSPTVQTQPGTNYYLPDVELAKNQSAGALAPNHPANFSGPAASSAGALAPNHPANFGGQAPAASSDAVPSNIR